jgi:hypothetical protein
MICAVSLSMIVGSSAFTSTSPERSVSVNVVGDEDAYLGLSWYTLDRCGANQNLVTVTNQFETKLTDIDVAVVETDKLRATIKNQPTALGSGESTTVNIKLNPKDASNKSTRSVTVEVTVQGNGVTVETTQRTLKVQNCPTRGKKGDDEETVSGPPDTRGPKTTETGDSKHPSERD